MSFPELISVIIPTRNRRTLLQQAIESAITQTYTNIEIIVIDEASEDDTAAYLKNIDEPRLKVITHSTPQGGNIARNKGLEASSGTYVAFLDDDDVWAGTKLEKQHEAFKRDSEVGIVTCSSLVVYQDLQIERYMNRGNNYLYSNEEAFSKMLTENFIGGASFPLIKRECLTEVNGFRPEVVSAQETDLYLRILANGHKVYAVEDVLILYRVHSMNRISDSFEPKVKGLEQLFEYKKDYFLTHRPVHEAKKIEQTHIVEVSKIYTRNRKYKTFFQYFNEEKQKLTSAKKIQVWRNAFVHTPPVQLFKQVVQKGKTKKLNKEWKQYMNENFKSS